MQFTREPPKERWWDDPLGWVITIAGIAAMIWIYLT